MNSLKIYGKFLVYSGYAMLDKHKDFMESMQKKVQKER